MTTLYKVNTSSVDHLRLPIIELRARYGELISMTQNHVGIIVEARLYLPLVLLRQRLYGSVHLLVKVAVDYGLPKACLSHTVAVLLIQLTDMDGRYVEI